MAKPGPGALVGGALVGCALDCGVGGGGPAACPEPAVTVGEASL